ncbi:hypothetical protein EVG17_27550 [Klebsiella pneumoniae]|nr:hypothetical protein EVG17_27550 [Klebsiella pneumoniae]
MTDITELAQREKFEAWWERTQHNGNPPRFGWSHWSDGEGYKVDDDNSELDGMWSAWKAAGAELVEALEKAQQRIDELENDEVRQRLDNAEHQLYMAELAKNNLRASRKAQFRKRKAAEQRIAELESRTVKLPKRHSMLLREDFNDDYHTEMAYKADEVHASLAAAGIKVEAQ